MTKKNLPVFQCADLMFIVFCVPFTASDYVVGIWPFGLIWCKVVQYLVHVCAYSSVYTLVLMSVDRYLGMENKNRNFTCTWFYPIILCKLLVTRYIDNASDCLLRQPIKNRLQVQQWAESNCRLAVPCSEGHQQLA